MIINCMSYMRIKSSYTLFTLNQQPEESYYIVEKGKMEMCIDGAVYQLNRESTLSTKALVKNTKEHCYLKSLKRVYLFSLPLEKYTMIFSDFVDKLQDEKVHFLKKIYLFSGMDKRTLMQMANSVVKKKFHQRTALINEDSFQEDVYMIVEGEILVLKNGEISKHLKSGAVCGEMTLFNHIESYYSYFAEAETEVYYVKHTSILSVLGEHPIKKIIQSIFLNALKTSEILSKYFSVNNMNVLFEVFQLKYYFNDIIANRKIKKLLIPIAGMVYSIPPQSTSKNLAQIDKIFEKEVAIKGEIYGETLLAELEKLTHTLGSDECVVFEVNWSELLKIIKSYSNKDVSLYEKMSYIRNLPLFKGLSELKLFNIAEAIKSATYRDNEVIIKEGPTSDKFYIIKKGKVKIVINDIEVQTRVEKQSFGDISSQPGSYMRKANFVAKGQVDCYCLDKEVFEDIIDCAILKPFNKILLKDITVALDQLFYLKDLGQGSYGKVYLVHDKKQHYAMKTAEISQMVQNKASAQGYLNEKSIMSSVEHPFIVQLINTFKTREYIFFLIEYVAGQNLRGYLDSKQQSGLRNVTEVTFLAGSLCSILSYLQKKRIIHRDFKPDNLMLNGTGYLKAIDFGIAKALAGKDSTHTFIGTVHYMAPEIISGKNYSFGVDCWAVGVILYEVFYGKTPFGFGMKDPQSIYREITDKAPVLPFDPKIENVNLLLKELLSKNPLKRLNSFYRYKGFPLFQGFDFDSLLKMEMKSPFISEENNKGKEDLENLTYPFHQFIKNNIFCSSNELDEVTKKSVDDYLSDF